MGVLKSRQSTRKYLIDSELIKGGSSDAVGNSVVEVTQLRGTMKEVIVGNRNIFEEDKQPNWCFQGTIKEEVTDSIWYRLIADSTIWVSMCKRNKSVEK